MADPKPQPDYTPEMPDQLKRQMAEVEAIRAEMETAPPLDDAEPQPPAAPGEEPKHLSRGSCPPLILRLRTTKAGSSATDPSRAAEAGRRRTTRR